jgi:ribosomal protein L7/L12
LKIIGEPFWLPDSAHQAQFQAETASLMKSGHESLPVAAVAALQEGNKILAIKLVREARGLGLKQANDEVSAYISSSPELREKFAVIAERGRRGCLMTIAIVVAVVVAVVVSRSYRMQAGL